MTEIKSFLEEVNALTGQAKAEIVAQETRVETTAVLGKFHKVLQKKQESFTSDSKNDKELSQHAVIRAKEALTTEAVSRLVELSDQ